MGIMRIVEGMEQVDSGEDGKIRKKCLLKKVKFNAHSRDREEYWDWERKQDTFRKDVQNIQLGDESEGSQSPSSFYFWEYKQKK